MEDRRESQISQHSDVRIPNAFALDSDGSQRTPFLRRPSLLSRNNTGIASTKSVETKVPGMARRTLGICLMLLTIVMWTSSNFLASDIFADGSYSKPYFVTWLNVSFFSVFLLKPLFREAWRVLKSRVRSRWQESSFEPVYSPIVAQDSQHDPSKPDGNPEGGSSTESILLDESMVLSTYGYPPSPSSTQDKLTTRETAWLALKFCLLWFISNFFVSACLRYTTVASSSVLGATSSGFTLLFGAIFGAERFTIRKLGGVMVCLLGVFMISRVDLSGESDENRGDFPHKSWSEMAVGDVLALSAAACYGLYTILLSKGVGNETRLDVFLFFGFIGAFNLLFIWIGLPIMHWTGYETFEMPPTSRIWWIIIINGIISVISDVSWTYSLLLTSPLVITVGISLTIPMSLLGQMIFNAQSSSVMYWIGSVIVIASFLIINYESMREGEEASAAVLTAAAQPVQVSGEGFEEENHDHPV